MKYLCVLLLFRKTSCRSDWLRLVLQSIFAIITVTSFILIVIMAVKNTTPGAVLRPAATSRCHLQGCRVVCNEAPFFELYEEDILFSVMEADTKCRRVYLELHNPTFTNGTLPCNWLSLVRNEISHLNIFGGNLMHIPSGAFVSQFARNIQTLLLQDLRIQTLEPNSLVGLSKLRTFSILYCWIDGAQDNALRAIDDTLETLTIIRSGDWDPSIFTGFRGLEKLTIVDFSHNNFYQTLNKNSFVGLDVTKIVYLNSCRIKFIGPGTFDHLTSLEVLYLNDNLLSTVPPGLFDFTIPLNDPRPRIHLQDNYWYCDCFVDDLRQLVRREILLVEAKCTSPDEFKSMTFTQFDLICKDNATENIIKKSSYEYQSSLEINTDKFYTEAVKVNRSSCGNVINSNYSIRLIPAVPNNVCSSKKFQYVNLTNLHERSFEKSPYNKWLQFTVSFRTKGYSVVQIIAREQKQEVGLLWYQSDCPHEIYCLDAIPTYMKVYNTDPNASYKFCLVYLKNVSIDSDECVEVLSRETETYTYAKVTKIRVALYLVTMILCSCFGAVVVYNLIRRKPTLLKGSKRILFVKHRNIDALVLPPKLPLREDLIDFKDKEVFTVTSGNNHKLKPPNVQRIKSMRSDKSGSPSYISAMQPTGDQLAQWRIKHHFNNDLTISSRKSELSTLSWIDTNYYYSLNDSERTYESLK